MNIDKVLEFDKVKELWMELAVTEDAKQKIADTSIILSELELKKALKDTSDAKNLIEKLGMPPLQNVTEIKEIMESAKRGECLIPYQLERVGMILSAVRRLKDYLERGKSLENPLAFYEENLDAVSEMREEIARQIRSERVDDYASKELAQLRMQIIKKTEEMKQKADQLMRSNKEAMADSFKLQRNTTVSVHQRISGITKRNTSLQRNCRFAGTHINRKFSLGKQEIQLLNHADIFFHNIRCICNHCR